MRVLDPTGGNSGASGTTGGGTHTPTANWIDLHWTFTDAGTNGAVKGLEVVAYTGSDPTDTNSWVMPPLAVPATDTRVFFPLTLGITADISCAIRSVYNNGTISSWVPFASSVGVVP